MFLFYRNKNNETVVSQKNVNTNLLYLCLVNVCINNYYRDNTKHDKYTKTYYSCAKTRQIQHKLLILISLLIKDIPIHNPT